MVAFIANMLQRIYENNRVSETWGSPSVSQPTFALLRKEGFCAASRYLLQRLRETGRSDLSTVEKLTALVVGVTIVTIANTLLSAEKRPDMMVWAVRRFSPHAPKFPVALYTLGAALLVAGSGSGSSRGGAGEGDWSDTSTEYRAYGRPDEGDGWRQPYDTDTFDDLDTDRD